LWQGEKEEGVTIMYNDDPFAPWNDLSRSDDPFEPWNNPRYSDDPFAPWNSPLGDEKDLDKYKEEHHIR
jgi:hypothetical protein